MKFKNALFKKHILLFFFLTPAFLSAQVLNGKLKNTEGNPLESVRVTVKYGVQSTFTNQGGLFQIEAVAGDTLQIFYGGSPFEVVVKDTDTLSLTLLTANSSLEEKINDGVYTQKLKRTTGAVTRLSTSDFNQGHIYNPLQLIQGKAAGLTLAKPNGDPLGQFDAQLRGLHTIFGESRPLYIVDGLPAASLMTVDPQDIAAINIVRDAATAALYGTRGSNGLIVVETKKGDKNAGKALI